MQELYRKYIENLIQVQDLIKPQFDTELPPEQLVSDIRDNAVSLYAVHCENDRLLQDILFKRDFRELKEEEVKELQEFADRLFFFNSSLDAGVAHYVHRLLLDHARWKQDRDMYIRELYYAGLTLLYVRPIVKNDEVEDPFQNQIISYFSEGASYMAQYEEIENQETREYILRCLGNRKNAMDISAGMSADPEKPHDLSQGFEPYMKLFNESMEVYRSPRYRQMNPDIPWESYIYAMHFDRTRFVDYLRCQYEPVLAAAVLESAEYVYRHQEQLARHTGKGLTARTRYIYAAARYHAGQLPLTELLDTILKIHEEGEWEDYSGEGLMRNMRMPLYAQYYASKLSADEQQRFAVRVEKAAKSERRFLFAIPLHEYISSVGSVVVDLIDYRNRSDFAFQQHLLDYILAYHPPTYVHSLMVAWLAEELCRQMVHACPEWLVGTLGIQSVEAVKRAERALCQYARDGGLCHDLGKSRVLNYIGLYGRGLLDEEFACVQMHPLLGSILLKGIGYEELAQIALHHHHWVDGKGGYPGGCEPCPDHLKRLVELVSVADSIDAATDHIGRSYARPKSFARMVEELKMGAGTHYSRNVVALFDDEEFYKKIEKEIVLKRQEIYCDVYCRTAEKLEDRYRRRRGNEVWNER